MARFAHAGVDQMRQLLDAVMSVTSELSLPGVLQRIVTAATELVDARYGALGVLDPSGTRLMEFVTTGLSTEERARIGAPPEGHGILGLLIVDPRPLRLPDLNRHPDSYGFPPNHPPMTSFLGAPVLLHDTVFGNLYLTDKIGAEEFTDGDVEMVVALAGAAGLAIDNARMHEEVGVRVLLEERGRIARDLHDDVIQRVFAAGMSLQTTTQLTDDQRVRDRLETTLADLDTVIAQVRNTIFHLNRDPISGPSVRADVMALGKETGRSLGFDPVCTFAGPVDSAVDAEVAEHLMMSLREALSNVVRHAEADHVSITVEVLHDVLTLRVADDGRGIDPDRPSGGHGLANLAARAEQLGGSFEVTAPPDGGTVVCWSVPLTR